MPKNFKKIPGPDPQYTDICYEGPGVGQDNLGALPGTAPARPRPAAAAAPLVS